MTGPHSSCVQYDAFLAASPSPFFYEFILEESGERFKEMTVGNWCSEAATHIVS